LIDMSPNGEMISFARLDSLQTLWVVPYMGGEARAIARETVQGLTGAFTRDSEHVVLTGFQPDANQLVQLVFRVVSLDGKEVARFAQPAFAVDPNEGPNQQWSIINRDDPARNVYFMDTDVPPKQVTRFTDGRLVNHVWSHDMRRVAVVRLDEAGENVWVTNADGSSPKQLTRFDGQDVFKMMWTDDDRHIAVRAGTQTRDVVLVREFD